MKLLFLLLLFVCNITLAQKIEVKSGAIFLNSKKLTKKTTSKDFLRILGKPNKKFAKLFSAIWTYDSLGLRIYFNTKSFLFESLEFDYTKGEFDFSPKKTYSGSFIINGISISNKPSLIEFQKIREINFNHSVLDLYEATIASIVFTFEYSDDKKEFQWTAISYKD